MNLNDSDDRRNSITIHHRAARTRNVNTSLIHIPHDNAAVVSGGGGEEAVGRKCHRIDTTEAPIVRYSLRGLGPDCPEAHHAIARCRRQRAPLGRKRHLPDQAAVTPQGNNLKSLGYIPEDRIAVGARRQPLRVGRKSNASTVCRLTELFRMLLIEFLNSNSPCGGTGVGGSGSNNRECMAES